MKIYIIKLLQGLINKLQNIGNKTQQNFRINKKRSPYFPKRKRDIKIEVPKNKINKEEKEKKEIEEKNKTITNRINNYNSKKIITKNKSHISNKYMSKSFCKNPFENSIEKLAKKDINRTKSKFPNLKKDIKGALLKNIKKEFNKLENNLNITKEKNIKNDKKKQDKTLYNTKKKKGKKTEEKK